MLNIMSLQKHHMALHTICTMFFQLNCCLIFIFCIHLVFVLVDNRKGVNPFLLVASFVINRGKFWTLIGNDCRYKTTSWETVRRVSKVGFYNMTLWDLQILTSKKKYWQKILIIKISFRFNNFLKFNYILLFNLYLNN